MLLESGQIRIYNAKRQYEDLPVGEQGKPFLYALDDNGNPYSPSWYTLNLKSSIQLTDVFAASVGLENITDQRYRPYSSGIAGASRNVILSLRARF
jgi:hemoglobin/transferrin/lactoferrin receptor protein